MYLIGCKVQVAPAFQMIVISAAANGDTTAMCAILKHYEGYIAKLCTRTLKDDAGNTYSYVDEEMRNRLQVRLITRTLAFHVG
uniref:helix-turn-helix domain-containing protein n=1 Tax=Phocaeicola dorei TaxID=357276 RepID=UPI0032ED96AF